MRGDMVRQYSFGLLWLWYKLYVMSAKGSCDAIRRVLVAADSYEATLAFFDACLMCNVLIILLWLDFRFISDCCV